ncbi:MAG: N-acetylmuramoyl-L-alanine amidase, partial [Bacteroidota bacterium]
MTRTLPWLVLTTTLLFSISPLKATFFNNSLASQCLNSATALTVVNLTDILNDSEGHKSSIILAKNEPPFRLRTIVIDAGHGGHDPGCLGAGYYEKHLALELSQAFAQKVREQYPDIQVIMTRDKDVFIPLHERASIANQANADLFISIHCNAMPPGNSGTAGTETFVMGLHTAEHNLDVAKRENASILLEDNYERNYDYDPNSPEGHILLSMFQNAYLEQSILFAERVEHHFHNTAERKSRGVKQAGFVVLKETAMPSVLVEAGFLTNKKDEAFLRSEEGQELVATSLLNALTDYKAILEGQPVETFAANPPAAVASPPAFQPEPEPVQSYIPPSVPATPPTSKTYESPAVYTHTPPSVQQQTGALRAEPTIQPTPAQGTIIRSVPAQDRALQPRGKGDTSWAE